MTRGRSSDWTTLHGRLSGAISAHRSASLDAVILAEAAGANPCSPWWCMHATLDQEATDRPDNHTQLKAPLVFALRLPCTPDGHRTTVFLFAVTKRRRRRKEESLFVRQGWFMPGSGSLDYLPSKWKVIYSTVWIYFNHGELLWRPESNRVQLFSSRCCKFPIGE